MNLAFILLSTVIILPVLSVLLFLFFYRELTFQLTGRITFFSLLISAALSWLLFIVFDYELHRLIYPWLHTVNYKISIGFQLDSLSMLFLVLITTLAVAHFLFFYENLGSDDDFKGLFSCFFMIVFGLLVLVSGNNLVMFLFGLQLMGFALFFLIRKKSPGPPGKRAGRRVFVFVLFAGLCLLIAAASLLELIGNVHYMGIETLVGVDTALINSIFFILTVGLLTVAAQFPLCYWSATKSIPLPLLTFMHCLVLPVPVVYLIYRLRVVYSWFGWISLFLLLIGLSTALLAALIAVAKKNMGKILSYSAISQLGIVLFLLGRGLFEHAVLLLITNLFSLGLLFLTAGTVCIALQGETDIFKMGRLRRSFPLTSLLGVVAGLALVGLPALSGYWPRQKIMEDLFFSGSIIDRLLVVVLAFLFWLTAFYVFRFLMVVFWAENKTTGSVHESGPYIKTGKIILLLGTLFSGFFAYNSFFSDFDIVESIRFYPFLGWLALVGSAFIVSYFIYLSPKLLFIKDFFLNQRSLMLFLQKECYIEAAVEVVVIKNFKSLSSFLTDKIEKSVLEIPLQFINGFAELLGYCLKLLPTGSAQGYILFSSALFIILISLFYIFMAVAG